MHLEKEDSRYRFEIKITDFFKMKCWDITQPVFDNDDVEHVRYLLAEFPERLQEHVVLASRVFLTAAQLDEPEPMATQLSDAALGWWEDHQFDTCIVYGDEYNVYDDEPEFVTLAKRVRLAAPTQGATGKSEMDAL